MPGIRFTDKFCNFTSNFTPSLRFFTDIEAFALSLLCKHKFLNMLACKSGRVYFDKFHVWQTLSGRKDVIHRGKREN